MREAVPPPPNATYKARFVWTLSLEVLFRVSELFSWVGLCAWSGGMVSFPESRALLRKSSGAWVSGNDHPGLYGANRVFLVAAVLLRLARRSGWERRETMLVCRRLAETIGDVCRLLAVLAVRPIEGARESLDEGKTA